MLAASKMRMSSSITTLKRLRDIVDVDPSTLAASRRFDSTIVYRMDVTAKEVLCK
jgi:hypothetical protein